MARKTKHDEEMRSHYDFSGGIRGKYAARYAEGTNAVVLVEVFPVSGSFNEDDDVKLDAIYGKLLALSREYHYGEQPDSFMSQFFTGGDSRLPWAGGGIGLTWWLTRRGTVLLAELARLVAAHKMSAALDIQTITKTIENVLKANATNSALYCDDPFLSLGTLYEARRGTQKQFAEQLWSLISKALDDSVIDWLIVAPLNRVKAESTLIGFDGLSLVSPGDDDTWRVIASDFVNAQRWNSTSGLADVRDERIMSAIPADCWLACHVNGTDRGARRRAEERMRTFVALVFAFSATNPTQLLLKTAAQPLPAYITQYPKTGSRVGIGYMFTTLGDLLPSLAVTIALNSKAINDIRQWYKRIYEGSEKKRRRALVSSHFIHYAIIADDLERFIHFFIALDALFGIRGNVESSILDGIARSFAGDPSWRLRARKLFDLRSELVHGGTSTIDGWSGYEAYERHFRTEPVTDVAVMALTALREYESDSGRDG